MHRDVLRRQSLLDNALQLIFRDRRQGSVVAVKKRKPNVLIAHEEGWTSIGGIALAKTEETFIGTLARHNLLKTEPEVFVLSALKLQLPIFSAFLAHFQEQLSFAGGMKTEVQVVSNGPPVDLYDSISRLEIHFRAHTCWGHFRDLNATATDMWNSGRNCTFGQVL